MTSDSIEARLSPRRGTGIRDGIVHPTDCLCFACQRPVSQEEFIKIQSRDQARIAELTDRIKTQVLQERDAEIEKIRKEAAEREAAIRQEVATAAEAALAPQIAKARKDAARAAEQQVKAVLANQENIVSRRLQAQRATLEKARTAAVNAEKEKYFREKNKLEEQLQEMQRRIQRKSINELGDEGELDLFEQLKHAFPNDQIERIKKGKQGGDILHQIVDQKGQICGKILYEVKNTSRFMTKYLTDLRANQLREAADHGVLSTVAFPTGSQQVAVRENLVIVHPARAVAVATLLRRQVVEVFSLRLGREGREEKAQALYGFLISSHARELWDEIAKVAEDFRALDLTEKSAHDKVWGRRADLIRAMQSATNELVSAVDRITSGDNS